MLKRYIRLSRSSVVAQLGGYLKQATQKDPAPRKAKPFLQLLKDAAAGSTMAHAQGEVFSQKYWKPVGKTVCYLCLPDRRDNSIDPRKEHPLVAEWQPIPPGRTRSA